MYLYIKSVGNRIHGETKYFLYQISLPSARIYKVLKNSEHRNYRYGMWFFLNCPNVLHIYNGTEYRTNSLVLINGAMMCLDMEVYILFCCCHTEKL